METFKIENYEREHGAGTFLSFRHLTGDKANHVLGSLKRRLELPDEFDGNQVVRFINDKSVIVNGVDATREDFDLKQVLSQLKFNLADTVYLNWYRFDELDEVQTDGLCRVFKDIWYQSSDDLDIVDSNMNWLLSIAHHGVVSALSLRRDQLRP
jgi:hypothetical protein